MSVKKIKPTKIRPPKNKDLPKAKFAKDPKYKHAKHWLYQDDDIDEENFDITAIFGKDEEE